MGNSVFSDGQLLARIIGDADTVPISDQETCAILNLQGATFHKAVKSGAIKRSISIHYRFGNYFNFVGLYDILEYALLSNFFFLNYGPHPEINELVGGIVDEFVFLMDYYYLGSPSTLHPCKDQIKINLIHLCEQDETTWQKYWLYEGDVFSSKKCSEITLQTWHDISIRYINTVAGRSHGNPPFQKIKSSASIPDVTPSKIIEPKPVEINV